MYRQWLASLHQTPLFKGIDDEALNTMLECMKPQVRQYKQREIVALHGQPFQGIGIIASGKVSLNKETYSGNRIILNILDTGDIFGEMVAFSDTRVWPVTVITQEDSCLLFLPPDKVLGNCANICASHSTLIMNTLKILSNRALMLNRRIEHLSARSVRGKVSRYLMDLYNQMGSTTLTVPMKRHELADYLNIPRPSLSRELADLRDAGVIEFTGPNIILKKVFELEGFLE
jgi:CRP/FNR family transcriptional regulator, dissimilatory nitrate respiration regulator